MSKYNIVEHRVPCSYIRQYPRSLANSQEDQLYLSVKQYTPRSNPQPQPGDVTIIATHANALPKELYEPLWDELLTALEQAAGPVRLRSIWIADVAHQGASYVLNEARLGNDPGLFDHARDLAHFVNLYRDHLPRPIFGVGHSMGATQLIGLALSHPRLLTGLAILEPILAPASADTGRDPRTLDLAAMSTVRRDVWPSREAARKAFAKSPFYQDWDARALDQLVEHGVRNGPTLLRPQARHPHVTLTTPPAQEVYSFLRPNFEGYGASSGRPVDRRTHADLDPSHPCTFPFYRPEPIRTYEEIAELRPGVLYISGSASAISNPTLAQAWLHGTGTGTGGSGGAGQGRVKLVTLAGAGHLIAMEAPRRTAQEIVPWLTGEVERWSAEEALHRRDWLAKGPREKQDISAQWKAHIGTLPPRPSPAAGSSSKL